MDTVELMFNGVSKVCTITKDRNDEYLCTAADGSFVKFPADADLAAETQRHNDINGDEVEIFPEVTSRLTEYTPAD